MKRFFLFLTIPTLILSACSSKPTNTSMETKETVPAQNYSANNNSTKTDNYTADNSGAPKTDNLTADNTGMNKTEKNYSAEQQSNDKADVQLAADIRKAILKQKNLSVNSQNVKIIAKNGTVTLRGPVDNAEEKAKVAELAKSVPGVNSVVDETQVVNKSVASQHGKEVK